MLGLKYSNFKGVYASPEIEGTVFRKLLNFQTRLKYRSLSSNSSPKEEQATTLVITKSKKNFQN